MLESQKLNEIRSAVAGLIEQSMIAKLPEDVSGLISVSGATDAVESLTDDVVQRITDRIQIGFRKDEQIGIGNMKPVRADLDLPFAFFSGNVEKRSFL